MVERLKAAITKARAEAPPRAEGAGATGQRPPTGADALWASLPEIVLKPAHLHAERVVTHDKNDPAYVVFDVVRTRMARALRDNGWSRVGITSPTKGCGKTVVTANLALSLARQQDLRTVVVDMDLKAPRLASCLGIRDRAPIAWYLKGDVPLESHFLRVGGNLALGINGERVRDSAELIQDERTGRVLADQNARLAPDVVLYDLPPLLTGDDALAFLPHLDCVLLVIAAGQTTAAEVDASERLLADQTHFLGVLLNKATGDGTERYGYEYQ